MANELRGDFSEAAVILALEALGFVEGDSIHWRHTPRLLRVCKSDIVVGRDAERPRIIVQVCSSGYAGGYQKKFWRDVGELIEIRHVLPKCRVLGILFEPGAKEKLLRVYDFISDGHIQVSFMRRGTELLAAVSTLAAKWSSGTLKQKLHSARIHLPKSAITELAGEIRTLLSRTPASWDLDHTATTSTVTSSQNWRRAILISALFSEGRNPERALPFMRAAEKGLQLPSASFLEGYRKLGVCERAIGGSFRLVDRDLLACVRAIGAERFVAVASKAIQANAESRLFEYVTILRNLPKLIPSWFDALRKHYRALCSETQLARALIDNYGNHGLWLPDSCPRPGEPWVFRRALDLIRAAEGKHFAIGIPRFDPAFVAAGLPALRFTISKYIAGRRPLSKKEANVAARILSRELRSIENKITSSLFEKFVEMVRRSEFNQRLITYRGFDPFPVLLAEQGIKPQRLVPSIVRHLGLSGAATCEAYVSGTTISMWQGASKEGVAHKVKENVGRMGLCCLEVRTDERGRRRFQFRPQFKERILYVDGAWGENEVQSLLAGCFTEVRALT